MQTSTLNQRNPRTLISNFFIGGLRQSTLQDIFSQKNKNMIQKSTGNEAEILFSLYENDSVDTPEGKILKSYLGQTFPELVKIHTREALVDPKFYSFLTSDLNGNNQFCHVLVFYERFTLEKIKSDFDVFAEWRKLDQKIEQKNWAKNVRKEYNEQKMKAGSAKGAATMPRVGNSQDMALHSTSASDSGLDLGELDPTLIEEDTLGEKRLGAAKDKETAARNAKYNASYPAEDAVMKKADEKDHIDRDLRKREEYASMIQMSLKKGRSVPADSSYFKESKTFQQRKQSMQQGTQERQTLEQTSNPLRKQNTMRPLAEISEMESEHDKETEVVSGTSTHGSEQQSQLALGTPLRSSEFKSKDGERESQIPEDSKGNTAPSFNDPNTLKVPFEENSGNVSSRSSFIKKTTKRVERFKKYQYVPIAFMIQTELEHHDIFKEIMMSLFEHIRRPQKLTNDPDSDQKLAFADFMAHIAFLATIPSPSFNTLFKVEIFEKTLMIEERGFDQIPNKNEIAIRVLFDVLDVRTILFCWKALIFDKSLVLLSTQYSLQFYIVSALQQLIFPLVWSNKMIQPANKANLRFLNGIHPIILCVHPNIEDFEHFESFKGGFNELAICDIDGSFTNDLQFPKLEDENLHLRAIIALKNHRVTRLDSAFSDKYKDDLEKNEKHFVNNVRQIFLNLLNTFLYPVDQYIQRPKDKQMDQNLQFVEYFDQQGYLSEFTGSNLKFAEQLTESAQFVHFCDDYSLDDLCNYRMYQKICKNSATLLSLDLQSQTEFEEKMNKIEDQVRLQCQNNGSSYEQWQDSISKDGGFKIRDEKQIRNWPQEDKITVVWRMPQDNQRVMLYEMLDYHAQVIQKVELYKFQLEKEYMSKQCSEKENGLRTQRIIDDLRKKEAAIHKTYTNFVKTMVDIKEHYPKLLDEYTKQLETAQKELTIPDDDNSTMKSEGQSEITSVSFQDDSVRIKTFKEQMVVSKSQNVERNAFQNVNELNIPQKGKQLNFYQIDEQKEEDESNRNSFQKEEIPPERESEVVFSTEDLGFQIKPQTQVVARQSMADESLDMDLAVFGQNENFNNLCTLKTSNIEQSEGDQTVSFIEPAQSQAQTRQNTVSIPTKKEAQEFSGDLLLKKLGNEVRQKLEKAKQDPNFQKKKHPSFNELVSNEIKDEKEALAQDKNRIVEFVYGQSGLLNFLDTLFIFFKNKHCLKDIFNYYFALKKQMGLIEAYMQEAIELVKNSENKDKPHFLENPNQHENIERKMSTGLNFNSPSKKDHFGANVYKSQMQLRVSKVFQSSEQSPGVLALRQTGKVRSSLASRFTVSRESTNMAMGGHKPVQVERHGLKEFHGVSKNIWLLPVIPDEVIDEDTREEMSELDKLLAYRYSCQFISMKTKILFHFEDFEEAIARIFDEFMTFPERDQDLFPIEFFKELLRFMSRPLKDRVFLAIRDGRKKVLAENQSCFQLRLMHFYEMKEKDDIDMELSLKHNIFQGFDVREIIQKREKSEAERQRKEKEALIRAQQSQTPRASITSSKGLQRQSNNTPACFAGKVPTKQGSTKDKKTDEQQSALRAKNQILEAKKRQAASGWSFLGATKKVKKQNPSSGQIKTNPEKLQGAAATTQNQQAPSRATLDLSSNVKNSYFKIGSQEAALKLPQTTKNSLIESTVSNQNQSFVELNQTYEEMKQEERNNNSIKLNMQKLYGISSNNEQPDRVSLLPDPNKKALKLLKSIIGLIEDALCNHTDGTVTAKRWKIKQTSKADLQRELVKIKKKELKLGSREIQIKASSKSPNHIKDANTIRQCFWLNIYNYLILYRIAEIQFCQSQEKNLLQEIQQHSMWSYFGLSARITLMGQTLNARAIRHTVLGIKQPAHFGAAFHEPFIDRKQYSQKIQDIMVDQPEPFLFFGGFIPFSKLAHLRLFTKANFKEQLQEACREQTLHLIQVDPSKFLVRISKAFLYSGNFRAESWNLPNSLAKISSQLPPKDKEKVSDQELACQEQDKIFHQKDSKCSGIEQDYLNLLQLLIDEKIIQEDSELYGNVKRVMEQVRAEIQSTGTTNHLFVMPRIAWQFNFIELKKSIQKAKLQVGFLNQNPELFK